MKDSTGSASLLFSEQVGTVTNLFEKWNDCEKTVVIYALLKRLRYPSVKFLQHSIENNINQTISLHSQVITADLNANSPLHLQGLVSTYKSFSNSELIDVTDKDTIFFGSDFFFKSDGKMCNNKEDLLNDVLEMLPLLKPGNDEAKLIYLSLIPIAVEDTLRQVVPAELVQQIFSYLLIHPAITNEDRRSLRNWLGHLEEHIQSSYASSNRPSLYFLSNSGDLCSSNSSTSVSSSSAGSIASRNAWQTIAPPQPSNLRNLHNSASVVSDKTDWNVNIPNISDNLCDNFSGIKLNELGSSQNSLGLSYNGSTAGTAGNCPFGSNSTIDFNTNTDDHHISFSKNGTEIIDFSLNDCDINCSCAQIGFPSLQNACDHLLNTNRWNLDNKLACLKTRRSNSLTTAISSLTSSNNSATPLNDNCSNSSENLAQYMQKPRSFSLSIDNPRTSLLSMGSDTRLDDLKPNYLKFTTHNAGMSNIGHWLKSLRLHKYIDLFKNVTYEAMMQITEEYLQELGVTKGASHKLALCIEKLKDRESNLVKIEHDLLKGHMKVHSAVEELANMVLTPMKPVDSITENVAYKFIKVLEIVSGTVINMDSYNIQDEECISALLWVLERAVNTEAFAAHINQLKETKFKISKLKISFTPKPHYPKSGSNGNLCKPRWHCKSRKTDQKNGSNDKINRKNLNEILNFTPNGLQQMPASRSYMNKGNGNNLGNYPQYKSSSYPSFMGTNIAVSIPSFHQIKPPSNPLINYPKSCIAQTPNSQQQASFQQQRHSLNNLIGSSPVGSRSNSNVCVTNSPMQSKQNISIVMNDAGQNVGNTLNTANQQSQQSIAQPQNSDTTSPSTVNKTNLEKTMAAVVLVSSTTNNNDLGDLHSIENNNSTNLAADTKSYRLGVSSTANSCSSLLSNNICSAITNNLFISPTSGGFLGKESHLNNNNVVSDIKSLEQLEFLCLQMTEQAIN